MALAYGDFHELSHQLRFLLFEIGIGLPQNSIDSFIALAHKTTLQRLEAAASTEPLINSPIISHHVHDFLDQLRRQVKSSDPASHFYQWNAMRHEIDESIANEALAHAYKQRWNAQLKQEAHAFDSLWEWIKNKHSAKQALLFLHQWGYNSHPCHPAAYAKIGFTRREVLQNSAEFQAKISLHWCAVRREEVIPDPGFRDYKSVIKHEFPFEFNLWQEKLLLNHLNPEHYVPVPVHPWQWRNKLQNIYSPWIDNKSLILFPHHQMVMPSMSYDVMTPGGSANCLVKLPIAIRTVETGHAEPMVSYTHEVKIIRWVNALLEQKNHYQNTLFLSEHYTSLQVNSPSNPAFSSSSLGVNILQNPGNKADSGQKVVPLISLFSHSPLSDKQLITEVIKASGLTPTDYFRLYCQTVLLPPLHLLLKYGIALEVLPRNLLIVFSHNLPKSIIIADHAKIKVASDESFTHSRSLVAQEEIEMSPYTLSQLRACFTRGILQNHLGLWISGLKEQYSLPSQTLWRVVGEAINTILDELKQDIAPYLFNEQKDRVLKELWLA